MNDTNQNFEELRKLLKLKRHEIPPPGYFNKFSDSVIARIEAGDGHRLQAAETPWLLRFLRMFESKPGLVGGFATSLCLLLIFGVVVAERPDATPQDIFAPAPSAQASGSTQIASLTGASGLSAMASQNSGISVSTNPITSLQPVASMFGQPNSSPLFQTASFAGGNN